MTQASPPRPVAPHHARLLAAAGAVLAAASVALAAYGSHVAGGEAQRRLLMAAVFAFGHGIALASLARASTHPLERAALVALLGGTVLFSGSLAAAHFFSAPTRLAPLGGGLMILAWLLYAVAVLKR